MAVAVADERTPESDLPIQPVYRLADLDGWDAGQRLGAGAYPFARGAAAP